MFGGYVMYWVTDSDSVCVALLRSSAAVKEDVLAETRRFIMTECAKKTTGEIQYKFCFSETVQNKSFFTRYSFETLWFIVLHHCRERTVNIKLKDSRSRGEIENEDHQCRNIIMSVDGPCAKPKTRGLFEFHQHRIIKFGVLGFYDPGPRPVCRTYTIKWLYCVKEKKKKRRKLTY